MSVNVSLVAHLSNLVNSVGTSPASSATGDHGFAQMLNQQRTQSAPAPAPVNAPMRERSPEANKDGVKDRSAESRAADRASETRANESRANETRANQSRAADNRAAESRAAERRAEAAKAGKTQKAEGPAREKPAPTGSDATAEATDVSRAQGAEETPANAAPTEGSAAVRPPVDAALVDWMAGLKLPAHAKGDDAVALPVALATTAIATDKASTKTADLQALDTGKGTPTAAGDGAAAAQAAKPDFAAQLVQESRGQAGEGASTRLDGVGGAHALGSAHAPASASSTVASAPATQATVSTPAESPEFPQALGVQVSLMAKQGVQQAELQLNPAEMGPIVVQIALDGAKAQVDFAATSAQTRQILENGLPELAASLRDAGLTLTGGGVFQQPRQPRQGESDASGNASGGDQRIDSVAGGSAEAAPQARHTARISASGVDIYA